MDDIVVSGISGRLPESSNIDEFRNNLFNGVDMVTDDQRRWPSGLYDLPSRLGKIKQEDLENFDPSFFGVHQKQAECMDPVLRMLLESTHEAIIDSGPLKVYNVILLFFHSPITLFSFVYFGVL